MSKGQNIVCKNARKNGLCSCRKQVPLNAKGRVAHDGCSVCAGREPFDPDLVCSGIGKEIIIKHAVV